MSRHTFTPNNISILFFGDISHRADAIKDFIKQQGRGVTVTVEDSVRMVHETLEVDDIDCAVFDTAGIDQGECELVQSIRDTHSTLPIILYLRETCKTGAREAIQAGATDCIQAEDNTNHEVLLANRILSFVERYTLKREVNKTETKIPPDTEVAAVSREFLEINQMAVESQVDSALERVGSRVEAERSYVFQIDHEANTISNTHEWTAEGVSPEIDNLQNLPFSTIPWWMEKLKQHETIAIPDVAELPPEAEAEQEILEAQNIQSVIVSPMISEGELIGFIGFDWTKKQDVWSENFVHILRVYAETIISAIQLERERKLQAQNERLDNFADKISHDLRNPLSTARGWTEAANDALSEKEPDTELAVDLLANATDSHERMDSMISNLLRLARSGQTVAEKEPVSIATIAQTAWRNTDTGESTIDVAVPNDVTIPADGDRLLHVFENLFRNAVDHNASAVTVRVGTLDEPSTNEDRPDGFFVSDTGQGIPERKGDDVFEREMSTADDGTGFGLSIVQNIVEAHGWNVSVTDGQDGGAKFVITGIGDGA